VSEYRKEAGAALVVAVVAGLAVTGFAFHYLPSGVTKTVYIGSVAPGVQIANTNFAATAGSNLTIRFNVTAYQPGTLHWTIFNGTGQTAFLFVFQNEGLPNGVTAAFPDGTSSNGNRSNVAVVLSLAPSTAGKTFLLQLVVWQAPESNPQQPIATAETLTVNVGPAT